MNTIDILSQIARQHHEIAAFHITSFPHQRQVQESLRPWGDREQRMFRQALDMKKSGVPFWNAVMLSSFDNSAYSPSLIGAALHHNPIDSLQEVSREQMLHFSAASLDASKRWAVNSRVRLRNGRIRHLPMIDFHIPATATNTAVVRQVCQCLSLGDGYILKSGVSYHFLGTTLVTRGELLRMLARALLFCPIIDGAWLSHQLLEESCSLRIDRKNGVDTEVV